MNYIKRFVLFILCCLTILPVNVNATGGALKKSTIKTCPNGITYGLHSDGKGGTHWHVAITNGKNYYPNGEAIYYDPCPDSNKNEGTAGSTNGGSNNSSNNTNDSGNGSIDNSYNANTETNNNSYNSNTRTNGNNYNSNTEANDNSINDTDISEEKKSSESKETKQTKKKRSGDNSIKKIIIDSHSVDISDNMSFNTTKKNVDIHITTNSSSAKVEYSNSDLKIGNNIFAIKVIAENGDIKQYNLNIIRDLSKINKFVLDNNEIKFKNNKAVVNKFKNETTLEYSYVLSDDNAKLILYHNDEKVEKLDNLKNNDVIKIVVLNEENDQNVYEITIEDLPFIFTILSYYVTILLLISPIIIIVIIIVCKKKPKKNKI